jgi:hypothetical protein
MKQNTTLLVLGLTLAITAALAVAPTISEMAYAATNTNNGGNAASFAGINGGAGGKGDNAGGKTPSGHNQSISQRNDQAQSSS